MPSSPATMTAPKKCTWAGSGRRSWPNLLWRWPGRKFGTTTAKARSTYNPSPLLRGRFSFFEPLRPTTAHLHIATIRAELSCPKGGGNGNEMETTLSAAQSAAHRYNSRTETEGAAIPRLPHAVAQLERTTGNCPSTGDERGQMSDLDNEVPKKKCLYRCPDCGTEWTYWLPVDERKVRRWCKGGCKQLVTP